MTKLLLSTVACFVFAATASIVFADSESPVPSSSSSSSEPVQELSPSSSSEPSSKSE